jgi:transcriptional regulator with XRE-family HTH domain
MFTVKKMRSDLGVTQKELAQASNLDIRWIQKVESGEINLENITVKKFFLLAKGVTSLAPRKNNNQKVESICDIYLQMKNIFS